MTASLTVWWDGRDVGLLSLDRHGEMRFGYSETWLADETAPPVSFSLPKRQEPFSRREARPFFEGLLPEEEQREAIAAALGISKGNEFRLLESLGGEVAGALTLWPTGEALPNIAGCESQHATLGEPSSSPCSIVCPSVRSSPANAV